MSSTARTSTTLIFSSIVLALLLSIFPLPDWAAQLRPQWLTLVLIFWCLMAPEKVGIGIAWLCGLLLDAMTGSLLGAHALSLAIVAYITLNIYQRTRIFPLWQQSLIVFSLLLLEHVLNLWIIGLTNKVTPGLDYWFAPFVGLFLWPWLYILLSELQHRLRRS
ncbi:MAG: rod shape-determining protein MreD [Chromatiales bacterium]|jgi:rod shape-determining protein MreD